MVKALALKSKTAHLFILGILVIPVIFLFYQSLNPDVYITTAVEVQLNLKTAAPAEPKFAKPEFSLRKKLTVYYKR